MTREHNEDSSDNSSESDDTPEMKQMDINQKFLPDLHAKFLESSRLTKQMYLANYGADLPPHKPSQSISLSLKINDEYASVKDLAPPVAVIKRPETEKSETTQVGPPTTSIKPATEKEQQEKAKLSKRPISEDDVEIEDITVEEKNSHISQLIDDLPNQEGIKSGGPDPNALVVYQGGQLDTTNPRTQLLLRQRERARAKPVFHAPWKLMRVIAGHLGWVRCVDVDPANEWFCTGSADRTIKIWDLASGTLKLTLTGHISGVRGLAVSHRHPYLFSVSDDKTVRCWDLEYNKVIRSYHGHLSGVYCCKLHPTVDVLMSGGRDSTCRIWDIRTKNEVRVLGGHTNTVACIGAQSATPQVLTGSHDTTVKLWDIVAGKSMTTLTNHKKSVRSLGVHPTEYTFFTGAPDNIKVWKCPEGEFLRNITGHNAIVNTVAINRDNVLVSGADNGSLKFWDWKTGYNFFTHQTVAQPGSLDSENGIFSTVFDMTGSRLITTEADKTIKMYKEDDTATEESHPIDFRPPKKRGRY